MPAKENVKVKNIYQNLKNLRTVPQADETNAINSLIAVNPDWFYSLMESIIDSGYIPVENILVVKQGAKKLTVHEGNRRIAILKILLGLHDPNDFDLPQNILEKMKAVDKKWIAANQEVPCLVYDTTDQSAVDRIVSLVHGKGEKAGRLKWNSIARAREARDINGKPQPGLDLLEKYLKNGNNLNQSQKDRWSGDYPLTVLDETIPKLLPRMKLKNAAELAAKYPGLPLRKAIENLLHDIGTSTVGFSAIRGDADDLLTKYGFPSVPKPAGGGAGGKAAGSSGGKPAGKKKSATKAYRSNDPRTVKVLLRNFHPSGNGREKVVDLKDEALRLNINNTPLAFCFVLRSMFEISVKAYCKDHNLATTYTKVKQGVSQTYDKTLSQLLTDAANHLVNAAQGNKDVQKALHGARAELTKSDGILSVTSMNQLVHNPRFSIAASDIARLFTNIFPLLEKLN